MYIYFIFIFICIFSVWHLWHSFCPQNCCRHQHERDEQPVSRRLHYRFHPEEVRQRDRPVHREGWILYTHPKPLWHFTELRLVLQHKVSKSWTKQKGKLREKDPSHSSCLWGSLCICCRHKDSSMGSTDTIAIVQSYYIRFTTQVSPQPSL